MPEKEHGKRRNVVDKPCHTTPAANVWDLVTRIRHAQAHYPLDVPANADSIIKRRFLARARNTLVLPRPSRHRQQEKKTESQQQSPCIWMKHERCNN